VPVRRVHSICRWGEAVGRKVDVIEEKNFMGRILLVRREGGEAAGQGGKGGQRLDNCSRKKGPSQFATELNERSAKRGIGQAEYAFELDAHALSDSRNSYVLDELAS